MTRRILEKRGFDSDELFKALASETRLKILALLAERDMNINEMGQALGIMFPTVSKHVQALEQAGLVVSEYMPGVQGTQKRCRLRYDQLVFTFENPKNAEDQIIEMEMPVGLYSLVNPSPTCGLANAQQLIGYLDEPQSFLLPERASAQLLWMSSGFVEYLFANTLPTSYEITRIEISMEICSEAPDYENDHPSDITLWVNGAEVGTWLSPGDFGGKRGRLNPYWWGDKHTQFGSLKVWSITPEGSYIDGLAVSDVTIKDAMVAPQQPISVRIGNKPDADHVGGFNLFGREFGNYRQDLIVRLYGILRKQRPQESSYGRWYRRDEEKTGGPAGS
jgi:predicted transcriptional regulator